ncbi:uncharacterized protein LOC142817379 isoform X2 [Rhipicephalus microplus]|uniref:uncharacterized protein LOC142817379 isoform X2 n=1 Tax=Rhipicephalus microplus TaxID=6941 RepID=UPI003F6CA29E
MTLHQMNFCVYAWILIVSSADETYRDRVLQQYFKQLVPPLLYFPLPKHNFNVRNPFAFNGTLYRFNLTDGKLFVKTPNSTKFDGTTCNIAVWPYKRVMCIFPIDDSWANYTGKLSYGKPVVQTFQVNLTVEAYTLENSGWNNPADIFVYLEPRENVGNTPQSNPRAHYGFYSECKGAAPFRDILGVLRQPNDHSESLG